jgi:hypothetical protein
MGDMILDEGGEVRLCSVGSIFRAFFFFLPPLFTISSAINIIITPDSASSISPSSLAVFNINIHRPRVKKKEKKKKKKKKKRADFDIAQAPAAKQQHRFYPREVLNTCSYRRRVTRYRTGVEKHDV